MTAPIQLVESEFELSNGTRFKIVHNIPKEINAALENWLARTSVFTADSFCRYINEKAEKLSTGHVAMTRKQYDKIK